MTSRGIDVTAVEVRLGSAQEDRAVGAWAVDLFLATVRHEMTVGTCPLAVGRWQLRSVLQLSVIFVTSRGCDVTSVEVRLGLAQEDSLVVSGWMVDLFLATVRHEMTVGTWPLAGGSWQLRAVLQPSVIFVAL